MTTTQTNYLDQFTFLTALFNGDPAGPGPQEAEIKNRHGINFRVQDAPLALLLALLGPLLQTLRRQHT